MFLAGTISKKLRERLESLLPVLAWGVLPISGIRLGLHWKLRTLDKPICFPVLKRTIRRGFIPKLRSRFAVVI